MNNNQILIEDQYVQLNNWEKITHYSLPLGVLGASFVFIFVGFKGTFQFNSFQIYFILGFWVIAILTFLLQRKRLKFKTTTTDLSKDELIQTIEMVGQKLEWIFTKRQDGFIEAVTDPSIFSGSWGEKITIKYSGNQVFLNSICNPNKRGSLSSMGRNKINEQTLIQSVQNKNGTNSFIQKL